MTGKRTRIGEITATLDADIAAFRGQAARITTE